MFELGLGVERLEMYEGGQLDLRPKNKLWLVADRYNDSAQADPENTETPLVSSFAQGCSVWELLAHAGI